MFDRGLEMPSMTGAETGWTRGTTSSEEELEAAEIARLADERGLDLGVARAMYEEGERASEETPETQGDAQ